MNLTNDDKVQQKLTRVRPPRVKITYDVETGGAIEQVEIPFIAGIFANLSGDTPDGTTVTPSQSSLDSGAATSGTITRPLAAYKARDMVEIDRDSFDTVLSTSSVSVNLSSVSNTVDSLLTPASHVALASGAVALPPSPTLSGVLPFTTFDDFLPGNVLANIPKLNEYAMARAGIRELQSAADTNEELSELLDAIVQFQAVSTLAPSVSSQLKAATHGELLSTQAASWGNTTTVSSGSVAVSGKIVTGGAISMPITTSIKATGTGPVRVTGSATVACTGALSGSLTITVAGSGTIATSGTITLVGVMAGTVKATTSGAINYTYNANITTNSTLTTYIVPITDPATPVTSGSIAAQLIGNLVGPAPSPSNVTASAQYQQSLQNACTLLGYFTQQVLSPMSPTTGPTGVRSTQLIDQRVAAIDAALSAQLSAIMHSPSFQALEATWTGLRGLVYNTETGGMLKLRVFNAKKTDLASDLDSAVEFDQSKLFKMIYEAEYGTYGGFPYSLLVGDYEFGPSSFDIDLLSKLTQVAAAAHAPLISAASPALFNMSDFSLLATPRDLSQIFEGASWRNWNAFRQTEDSRYVTLVLPHVMLRQPYDYRLAPVQGFNFVEDVTDGSPPLTATINNPGDLVTPIRPVNQKFLWGNAAYSMAGCITNAFSLYNWTAAIRGEEGGGLVDGLPQFIYPSELGAPLVVCPTEVSITDRREKELNDLGFVALCNRKNSQQAVFFGGQTVNLPKRYVSDSANANARSSAMLPYMLAASRFAHYIKVMMRKKIGSFLTRANIESYINTWIAQYVLLDDNASQEVKASYPLRAAEVIVTDVPGEPGSYNATLFIKPHFQLEDLRASIRLVADLPKA